jgi:hypothetical protein
MTHWKKALLAVLLAILLGAGYWYYLVASYDSGLGTENSFVAHDSNPNLSNSTNDSLLSMSFDFGEDELEWAFTTVTLSDGEQNFDCTVSGLSSIPQENEKIKTKLNADGKTFTISIDSTSETSYTKMSLYSMNELDSSNHSIRFSKTDIFLGANISWMSIDGISFADLHEIPNENFSNDTSSQLDWYDYDLSTHRIEPKDRIFVINDIETTYKIQFLSYYNEQDESRYITMVASWLDGAPIPAINDSELVKSSPCIIIDENHVWESDETIFIQENNFDICHSSCALTIIVTFEDINVEGTSRVDLD